jgi:hypothetical protein
MGLAFKKAEKSQSRLRLAIAGVSGAGKTFTALRIASALGSRIAVIDTERGSASLYSDKFSFDVAELESFSPAKYVDAIHLAEREGYDVIIIDSLSHAWSGKDGALELVEKAAIKSRSQNSYTAWRDVTPEHNSMVEAILQCRAHVIATMRSKTEYVLEENASGKKVPVKRGMAPIQRAGMEYEFTLFAEMDQDHNFVVTKTRCDALDGAVIKKPGEDVANTLRAWLGAGAPIVDRPRIQTAADVIVAALNAAESPDAIEAARKLTAEKWGGLTAAERAQVVDAGNQANFRVSEIIRIQSEQGVSV